MTGLAIKGTPAQVAEQLSRMSGEFVADALNGFDEHDWEFCRVGISDELLIRGVGDVLGDES